jgi:hypothetical protein
MLVQLAGKAAFCTVACLVLAAIPSVVRSATITHEPLGKGVELIRISGEISSGDENKFRVLALRYDKAVVALNSDGGELSPALEIGKAIHIRDYDTFVIDGDYCASACALIWVAGSTRLLEPRANIGFHASYFEKNGRKVESGVANALVGRYLTQLELPERAIVYATTADPTSIRWLKPTDQDSSGIPFEIVTDDSKSDVSPPAVIDDADLHPVVAWRVAAVSKDGSVYFVGADGITRDADEIQFFMDAWSSTVVNGANRLIGLVQADCRTKAYRPLSADDYLNDRHIRQEAHLPGVKYPPSESAVAGVIDAACKGDYLSQPVANPAVEVARIRSRH